MTTEFQKEQAERVETLRNDARLRQQQQGTTLSQFAQAEANLDLGRFGTLGNPHVTGSTAIPNYPAASPPFQHDPVPDEPALGVDVNAMEPCGEAHELRASIAAQELPPEGLKPVTQEAPGDPTVAPSKVCSEICAR